MNLSQWIAKEGGTGKVAKKLNVPSNCVYAWKVGNAIPRPDVMQRIVRTSRGKVSYDSMVAQYVANRKRNAAKRTRTKGKAKTGAARRPTVKTRTLRTKAPKRKLAS